MKKLLLSCCVCAFFLVGFTIDATAQRSSSSSDGGGMAIKTNPITLAFNFYNASLEKSFGRTSIILGGSFFTGIGGVDVTAFGADLSYRYYFTNGDMEGFYINPKVGFNVGSDAFDSSFTGLLLAAELGYQVRTDGGFIFDIGIGPAWRRIGGDSSAVSGGGLPSATLAIGYAF